MEYPTLQTIPEYPTFQMVPEYPTVQHSCSYCGLSEALCLLKCNTCQKSFCNSTVNSFNSHIVMHLTRSKHHEVSLHNRGPLGETCFKCRLCCSQNVFKLGYLDETISPSTDFFCRLPCAAFAKSINDVTNSVQGITYWKPLISEGMFTDLLVKQPSEHDLENVKPRLNKEIAKMEELWRVNPSAVFADLLFPTMVQELERVALRYESADTYRSIFSPLVKLEADYDKDRSRLLSNVNSEVRWEIGHDQQVHAYINIEKLEDIHLMHGNRISLKCAKVANGHKKPWNGVGYVFKLPKNFDNVVGISLEKGTIPPMDQTQGFAVTFKWNPTAYMRMQKALHKFVTDENAVSVYIYRRILGHNVEDVRFKCGLPSNFSAPNLPTLNESQVSAVTRALQQSVSLIQGPPGTGKTVTSATIVYHLANQKNGQILVCAPSNTAVDHLAEKIHMTKLNVVRVYCKSREALDCPMPHLSLHYLVRNMDGQTQLKDLQKIKDETGKLSPDDNETYKRLVQNCEQTYLKNADVICCTCACAGDARLDGFQFKTVLIDESTQAIEPECLIPIVKGVVQIILVGDQCQLGPVVTCPKAVKAGLGSSLFQRFLVLGSLPCVLNQQYRMHPELSKFPSELFYEGALKDGISADDRQCTSGFPWPTEKPMLFYAIFGAEEISGTGISFLNRMEALYVEKIVAKLLAGGVKSEQIGIITPYDGQKLHILQHMKHLGSLDYNQYQDLEVASVDGFQGREKDYIILSCVRSNKCKRVGFLNDPRRLNVAITRARYGLIIVGDAQVLAKQPLWNHLLTYYQEQNVLVEGSLDNLQPCNLQFNKPKKLVNKINPENHFMDLAAFESSSAIIPGDFSKCNFIEKRAKLISHYDENHGIVNFIQGSYF